VARARQASKRSVHCLPAGCTLVARADQPAGEAPVQLEVLDAAGALAKHPRIEDPKLAIVGSSHGALLSMLAVMESPKQFACLAQASGACDVPRTAGKIKLPVLLQHGWKDDVVDIGDAMYLSRSMRDRGNSWAKLHEYSMLGHGLWYWNDDSRYSSDQVAQAEWAWEDLTAFLARHMGS